ncbi:MAG: hypothetical protein RL562_2093 [Planctomycetota bacterium]
MIARLLTVLPLAFSAACSVADTGLRPEHGRLAIAWVRHAPERIALCEQAYRAATTALRHEAASARASDSRPLAVVVDVDETVLDNSSYNAGLVARGESFQPQTWSAWVEERAAPPIPGAVAFARTAAELGVTVFYVTNRTAAEEAATRDNLRALGFPLQDDGDAGFDAVLTRGERAGWEGSAKASRRAAVARTHSVVLYVGDDRGDFPAEGPEAFGETWFVLPNPMYGSWVRALPPDA